MSSLPVFRCPPNSIFHVLITTSAAAEAQKGLYLRSYPYRRYNKLILVSF